MAKPGRLPRDSSPDWGYDIFGIQIGDVREQQGRLETPYLKTIS